MQSLKNEQLQIKRLSQEGNVQKGSPKQFYRKHIPLQTIY